LDGKVQAKEQELTQALNRPQPAPVEVVKEVFIDRPVEVVKEVIVEKPVEVVKEVFVDRPIEVIKEVYIERPVEVVAPPPPVEIPHADPPPLRGRQAPATDEAPINPISKAVVIHDNPNHIVIPDFSINAEATNPVNAGFGDTFHNNPQKGDMYLRVDMLPSKLFKWNEKKWIEVDKTKTDSFAYDRAYIQHLIEKIDTGEYDVDLLTDSESEQIKEYLNEQSKK
jgi:hypothetical protein